MVLGKKGDWKGLISFLKDPMGLQSLNTQFVISLSHLFKEYGELSVCYNKLEVQLSVTFMC